MLALSVRQPYAEYIMRRTKRVEYRTIRTNIRGRIYIYASLNVWLLALDPLLCSLVDVLHLLAEHAEQPTFPTPKCRLAAHSIELFR